MTDVFLALFALFLIVVTVFGGLLLAAVRQVANNASHADLINPLHRTAIATEQLVNQQPVQAEARRLAEQNEALVLGISTVLDGALTHPDGLRDDVKLGRTQADTELKEQLRSELDKALNHTNR